MRRPPVLAATLLATTLALSACGGTAKTPRRPAPRRRPEPSAASSTTPSIAPSEAGTTPSSGTTVDITIKNGKVTPNGERVKAELGAPVDVEDRRGHVRRDPRALDPGAGDRVREGHQHPPAHDRAARHHRRRGPRPRPGDRAAPGELTRPEEWLAGYVSDMTDMTYRPLGPSGLMVSTIGLGTNAFGSRIDEQQSRTVVDAAIDAGVTLFDTSDIYGTGASEEVLGGPWAPAATTSCWPPSSAWTWAGPTGRTGERARRGATCARRSRPACAGWAPTTSTSTSCTSPTSSPRSRRPWRR